MIQFQFRRGNRNKDAGIGTRDTGKQTVGFGKILCMQSEAFALSEGLTSGIPKQSKEKKGNADDAD